MPKRRNFAFDATNGYDGIYVQSHYIRILPVKIPRYSDGNIIGYDVYDYLQGKETENCLYNSYCMSHPYHYKIT